MEEKKLGLVIKQSRKKLGLTCSQFANKCSYSRTYISQIENGNIEVSEDVYTYLFRNLELDYWKYKEENEVLKEKLNQTLNSILYENLEQCDIAIFKNDKKYQYFPCYSNYLLIKFVYYVLNKEESIDEVIKQIVKLFRSFNEYDKQIYYTYLALYHYKVTGNINEVLELLKKSLEMGDFLILTGVTLSFLSGILYNYGELLFSYVVNKKAEKKLLQADNWNVFCKNKITLAKIIAELGGYEYSLKILTDILNKFIMNQAVKKQVEIEMAYINFRLQRYDAAKALLHGKDDVEIFIKMCILLKENHLNQFTHCYKKYASNILTDEQKAVVNILYYKMTGDINNIVYHSMLKELLKTDLSNCRILTKNEILDELIKISIENKCYKEALCYSEQKSKEVDKILTLEMLTSYL